MKARVSAGSLFGMRNLRVLLSYDGSRFYGWQRQAGFPSVQESVEEALLAITGERVTVHGSGRTDTGVHALGQVASFHLAYDLSDFRLLGALNAHLPRGVVARALEGCAPDFHARFSALGKRYVYVVRTGLARPPFGPELSHWSSDPLDLGRMRRAAALMLGTRDFSAFQTSGSPRTSCVRSLRSLHVVPRRRGLAIAMGANGFLYNMARVISGTLLDVGRGKLAPEEVPAILSSRDRRRAGPTLPPEGLYLWSVRYAEPCFLDPTQGARPAPGVSRFGLD